MFSKILMIQGEVISIILISDNIYILQTSMKTVWND